MTLDHLEKGPNSSIKASYVQAELIAERVGIKLTDKQLEKYIKKRLEPPQIPCVSDQALLYPLLGPKQKARFNKQYPNLIHHPLPVEIDQDVLKPK